MEKTMGASVWLVCTAKVYVWPIARTEFVGVSQVTFGCVPAVKVQFVARGRKSELPNCSILILAWPPLVRVKMFPVRVAGPLRSVKATGMSLRLVRTCKEYGCPI